MMIEHSASMILIAGPNGEIFYANAAFREWSEYSLIELETMGWKKLSVENDSLDADIDSLKRLVDGYIQSYVVRKQYRTKSGAAHWGNLHVLPVPPSTDIEFFACTWEPFKNGTATAFALAMSKSEEIHKRLNAMAADIEIRKARSTAERLWDSFGEWALENPKLALVVLLMLLSLNPAPIIITWVTRLGWLPAQPVQLEIRDNNTGQAAPATEQQINDIRSYAHAHQIADLAAVKVIEITTPAGSTVAWSSDVRGRGAVRYFPGCDGSGSDRIRRGSITSAGSDGGVFGMPGRAF